MILINLVNFFLFMFVDLFDWEVSSILSGSRKCFDLEKNIVDDRPFFQDTQICIDFFL